MPRSWLPEGLSSLHSVPPRFSPGGFRIFDADLPRRSAKHFMLVKQSKIGSINHSQMGKQLFQWIGFKETLQETPIFHGENPWKTHGFRLRFSLQPIQWLFAKREENTNTNSKSWAKKTKKPKADATMQPQNDDKYVGKCNIWALKKGPQFEGLNLNTSGWSKFFHQQTAILRES